MEFPLKGKMGINWLTSAAQAIDQIASDLLEFAESVEDDAAPLDALIRALDGVQALCWSGLALSEIPEPCRDDPQLQALKAGLIERLVEVFNHPTHGGAHHAPDWCSDAGGLATRDEIWLIRRDQAEWGLNPTLRRRGVMALGNFLMFA